MSKQILIPGSLPGTWAVLYGTKSGNNEVLESVDVTAGNLHVTDQTLPSYEDDQAEVAKVEQRYEPLCAQITTAVTSQVSATPGYLDALIFGGGTFGDVTIYDETTATGTPVFTLTPAAVGHLQLHWHFKIGCTIVTAAATRITPMGRKS